MSLEDEIKEIEAVMNKDHNEKMKIFEKYKLYYCEDEYDEIDESEIDDILITIIHFIQFLIRERE